jgi:hypothetical protein
MHRWPRFLAVALATATLLIVAIAPVNAGCCAVCCDPCAATVCCPPPPVPVQWCVTDPVTCCSYVVSACVPACCGDTPPCLVGCRRGVFGRKVLTYQFACCGHCVEVVITKHGRTIVRG